MYLISVYLTGVHLMGVHLMKTFRFSWSICRDLSYKIRVFVLVAGWSLLLSAVMQRLLEVGAEITKMGATYINS